ncbi:glutathione S-transferase family protein [Halopseudomonas nanhaiensis]|uniref:glutathione S-transferase family protein n=1 Tax=Halopseudomonas nanhaiensis TaxID=2830842 RepID=UPI001CBE3D01|nr:glutathione S-transferase family protein [Halopseudomonas nanhaiensis]UAW97160.1 glutathione S-transferase family protein [Halopseudomonas nanhaiensis]
MSLTLYGAILSPFVRKIRIILAEHHIQHELVPQAPFKQPDWFYEISPLGRIPAIKEGDFTLADSSVIASYLDETRGPLGLYGTSPQQAARVRWLEKFADYELAPLTTFTCFRNRVLKPLIGEACDEGAIATALTEHLPPLFDYLESELGTGDYFLGDYSLADIAVASQLINMAHGGEAIDSNRWPGLAGLLRRVSDRSGIANLLADEQRLLAKMTPRT